MLRTKRVTDTLQTIFFLNNNIPRFLLNERAFFKKNLLNVFFLKKINTAVSFLTKISRAVSSWLNGPLSPAHSHRGGAAQAKATSLSTTGTHCIRASLPSPV